jgi:6-phosphogluconolactonase
MTDLPVGCAVRVFGDRRLLVQAAADLIVEEMSSGVALRRLVLPGGTTPVALYRELASRPGGKGLDPQRLRITFSDERAVPPGDIDSNFGMIQRELLVPIGVPIGRVLRIRGEDPPERAAEKLDRELRVWSQRVPLFDLVVLGMGADGHVASLFPGTASEDGVFPGVVPGASFRWTAVTRHPSGRARITLTPTALRSTPRTVFLVGGREKAAAVRDALEATSATPRTPSRLVASGGGKTLWLLDEEAASLLPDTWK